MGEIIEKRRRGRKPGSRYPGVGGRNATNASLPVAERKSVHSFWCTQGDADHFTRWLDSRRIHEQMRTEDYIV